MNEIELLSLLRQEVPCEPTTPQAERAFRAVIASAKPGAPGIRLRWSRAVHPRARVRPGRRPALAAGVGVALVAVILAAAIASRHRLAGSEAASGAGSAAPALTLTELSYRASATALRGHAVRPDQWVYRRFEAYGGIGLRDPRGVHVTLTAWTTADGLRCARRIHVHGETEVSSRECGSPAVTYAQLKALPSAPPAILRYLRQPRFARSQYGPGASTALANYWAFDEIGQMLSMYVLQPTLTATLYHTLAEIPGVTVLTHARTAAGQTGVAFVLPGPPDTATQRGFPREQIILDPRDYRMIGWISVDPTGNPAQRVAAGNTEADSVLQQALVSGPGVQP